MRIESHQKALIAAKAALDKHAEALTVLDLRALSSVTDYFLVCTALSDRQMRAISDAIEEQLRRYGQRVWHTEGIARQNPRGASRVRRRTESSGFPRADHEPPADEVAWVLMDCGDVTVHVFTPPARTFYQLEHLWADAPQLALEWSNLPPPRASR